MTSFYRLSVLKKITLSVVLSTTMGLGLAVAGEGEGVGLVVHLLLLGFFFGETEAGDFVECFE